MEGKRGMEGKSGTDKKVRAKVSLTWSMIGLLTLCWLLPLGMIAYIMFYVAAGKINSQTERTDRKSTR